MSRSNHWNSNWDFFSDRSGDYRKHYNTPSRWVNGRRRYYKRTNWYDYPFDKAAGKCAMRHLRLIDIHGRHPSWCAQMWRKEYRNNCSQRIRNCQDFNVLQFSVIGKVTQAYDWY